MGQQVFEKLPLFANTDLEVVEVKNGGSYEQERETE